METHSILTLIQYTYSNSTILDIYDKYNHTYKYDIIHSYILICDTNPYLYAYTI